MPMIDLEQEALGALEKGSSEAVFCFGGLKLRFTTASAPLKKMISLRYPAVSPSANTLAEIDITQTVSHELPQEPMTLFEGRKVPISFRGTASSDWEIRGRDFSASFEAKNAHLHITGPLAMYPIDLACLVLWYTQQPHGLIIHGAGLRFDRDYWLCSGPSGVGKTTMTQLFPKQALCDEYCGVLTGIQPELVSLPFWASKPDQGRLAGIFMLEHSTCNRKSELSTEVAFRQLSAQVFWPYFDEGLTQQTLNNLTQLIKQTNTHRLGFRPTTDVRAMFATREVTHA